MCLQKIIITAKNVYHRYASIISATHQSQSRQTTEAQNKNGSYWQSSNVLFISSHRHQIHIIHHQESLSLSQSQIVLIVIISKRNYSTVQSLFPLLHSSMVHSLTTYIYIHISPQSPILCFKRVTYLQITRKSHSGLLFGKCSHTSLKLSSPNLIQK